MKKLLFTIAIMSIAAIGVAQDSQVKTQTGQQETITAPPAPPAVAASPDAPPSPPAPVADVKKDSKKSCCKDGAKAGKSCCKKDEAKKSGCGHDHDKAEAKPQHNE